jgi:hypothetical protein
MDREAPKIQHTYLAHDGAAPDKVNARRPKYRSETAQNDPAPIGSRIVSRRLWA